MSSSKNILATLLEVGLKALQNRTSRSDSSGSGRSDVSQPTARLRDKPRSQTKHKSKSKPQAQTQHQDQETDAGATAGTETIQVNPERIKDIRVQYAPDRDGALDAGEVVWTWVPYVENDGRGKDRPVLVIGRQNAERAYAVRMTSKSHEGSRDYISIASGAWDSQGRESWVDIEQLYSVHDGGMRREAAALDRERYGVVVRALINRYGWARES